MIRFAVITLCGAALLSACNSTPQTYPTTGGAANGTYQSYEQARLERERQLSGGATVAPTAPVSAPPLTPTAASSPPPAISSQELASAGLPSGQSAGGGLPAAEPVQEQTLASAAPIPAAPARPAGRVGISDEQSFEAVASRETIESDAERLERQRAAYQVAAPEALPQRTGTNRPNIVQYALTSTNRRGESIYPRGPFSGEGKARRACNKYPSSDLAQEDFLAQGGPFKDRLGVDPDGDGFACAWDPAPFRAAKG
ncbi:hypothetical protein [Palleronia caenipelagi]|uniref:Excalibur calcium-binding domain-containing protein n=1 Tax=Palleronia caenipelagi TaxID=2489174 RepID=A0A547Q758_9RHOB|nr:hypothetical protein [Palleronia caenipelagi]TRD22220.1 hypothetical protein FEV53_05725 [Palleronia caenipelagi]